MSFEHGLGTEQDPYQIWTVDDLKNVDNFLNAHFIQMIDIDLNSETWAPLGDGDPFTGQYDGGNFAIYNLKIAGGGAYKGLFSQVETGGFVKNILLLNGTIEKSASEGYFYTAPLIGFLLDDAHVENCHVKGFVIEGTEDWCGGLVGLARKNSTIHNCSVEDIQIEGSNNTGTFVGELGNNSSITESFSINSTLYPVGEWGYGLGTFVGAAYGAEDGVYGEIKDCYVRGAVDFSRAEGISGAFGGFAGIISGTALFNSYAAVAMDLPEYVYPQSDWDVGPGGMFGDTWGTEANTGGLYFDNELSNINLAEISEYDTGVAKTTAEMKDETTYAGWDFENTWGIDSGQNDGYPILVAFSEPVMQIPIATAEDLNAIRSTDVRIFAAGTEYEMETSGGLDKEYIQVADIDLSASGNWTPIESFNGVYDGANYKITNLTINAIEEGDLGLFGKIENSCSFSNIVVENATVEVNNNDNWRNITSFGILLSSIWIYDNKKVIVENCKVSGVINLLGSNIKEAGGLTGGIDLDHYEGVVGPELKISNCESDVVINDIESGASSIGGLIGYFGNWGEGAITSLNIENNRVFSTINNESGYSLGGLIGSGYGYNSMQILISQNEVETTINGTSSIGGLIGYLQLSDNSKISFQKNGIKGDLTGRASIGGFAGVLYADEQGETIAGQNYFEGNINAVPRQSWMGLQAPDNIGGFIGELHEYDNIKTTVSNCYCDSNLNVNIAEASNPSRAENISGFVGVIYDSGEELAAISFQNCYAKNVFVFDSSLTSEQEETMKGFSHIMDYADGTKIDRCYYDMDLNNMPDAHATGKTTAQMKDISTYDYWDITPESEVIQDSNGWNSNYVWGIGSANQGYPFLHIFQAEDPQMFVMKDGSLKPAFFTHVFSQEWKKVKKIWVRVNGEWSEINA